ncbi:MAG: hypothetical protein M1819_000839 [Sarea resinae]|nr:MAG: hypothetical protein M1819_000839 [Sarea resinae]
MASNHNNLLGPDTLVTVKVAIDGNNRRFKLALRDLGANVFPDKLKECLVLPPNQNVKFERYSDSAGAFIPLDSKNPAVYKQLYRAAKAKLKLRIKATLIEGDSTQLEAPPAEVPLAPIPRHFLNDVAGPSLSSAGEMIDRLFAKTQMGLDSFRVPAEPPMATNAVSSEQALNDMAVKQAAAAQRASDIQLIRERLAKRFDQCLALSDACAQGSLAEVESRSHDSESAGSAPGSLMAGGLDSLSHRLDAASGLTSLSNERGDAPHATEPPASLSSTWSVYCNHCDKPMTGAHFHCSICDDGDFDLCQSCVEGGVLCGGESHWLIKRLIRNGQLINSTTETIAPKKNAKSEVEKEMPGAFSTEEVEEKTRICNCCVGSYPEAFFVTCTTCDDYDLCVPCHVGMKHGHHPSHAFVQACNDAYLGPHATALCNPGRNTRHNAICDGCDKSIYGVRHKCLNCPDFDYCGTCYKSASQIHSGHRFVPIYEPLPLSYSPTFKHHGIYCDGPLCKDKPKQTYIVGDRYKCAVCHDTDFCANCEASPLNKHRHSHPLIKFKSPVRNVSVLTLGEKPNGEKMVTMGDMHARMRSTATETVPASPSVNAATQVQTVADLKPSDEESTAKDEVKNADNAEHLNAHFVRDVVADGSKLPPDHTFKQTWTLRNPGPRAWPSGCSVRFVGGDNMLNIDPYHPSSTTEMAEATESNVIGRSVEVGEEIEFTVTMKTPKRGGKSIAYWRLKTAEGLPFGHKLWCDVDVDYDIFIPAEPVHVVETEHVEDAEAWKDVSAPCEPEIEHVEDVVEDAKDIDEPKAEAESGSVMEASSTMVFPKLEKESPVSSTHELSPSSPAVIPVVESPATAPKSTSEGDDHDLLEDLESLQLEDSDDGSGFLTDEEYDILDASDEEFLSATGKESPKE